MGGYHALISLEQIVISIIVPTLQIKYKKRSEDVYIFIRCLNQQIRFLYLLYTH